MLSSNEAFPDFRLPDQDGVLRSLADYAGKWLILYFYPKDNTSACTLEAQTFSSMLPEFAAAGAAVVGASPDSVKSHAGFQAKREIAVTLLSDPDHALLEASGVWQKKKLYGKEHMGVVRSTFLIDPQGLVQEVWTKVKVPGHVEAVLEKLKELQNKSAS